MTERRIHVHILNTPDIAAYWIPADSLKTRLSCLAEARQVEIDVTESHDLSPAAPTLERTNVLVGFNLPTDRIRTLRDLRWIHLISAGVDHLLPLDWLPARVALTNSSGVHSELAGEYACCALLMLNIGIPTHATNQRTGHWNQVFNAPIRGRTVTLVGVGAIGGAAAFQAKRLGLRVLGIRKSGRRHRFVDEMFGPEDLQRVLPRSDFLVVTASLTPETRGMIGSAELDALPLGAGVINMSRASLVDYDALSRKLERGELRAAIIDVCDPEPLPSDSPLWRVKNLLVTPHVSSDPIDYVDRTIAIFSDNLARLLTGRPMRNRVDRRRGY